MPRPAPEDGIARFSSRLTDADPARLLPLRLYMLGVAIIAIVPGMLSTAVDVAGDIAYFRAEQTRRLHDVADQAAVGLDREIAALITLLAGAAEAAPEALQDRAAVITRLLGQPVAPRGGVTDLLARPGQDGDGVAVILPVRRDGAVPGVLEVPLTEARIRDLIGGLVTRPGLTVDVLDLRGRLVARAAAAGRSGLAAGTPLQLASPGQGRLMTLLAADGSQLVAAVAHPSRAPGWQVVASEPSDAADKDWIRRLVWQSAVFAAAALIAVIAAWRLGGRLTRPLALLGERARAVAAGDDAPGVVPASGVLEFEILRASLQRAELALRLRASAAHSALQEARSSAELLTSVVNATADLIFVTGLDGRYILANQAAVAVYGAHWDAWLILGKRASELLPPDLGHTIEAVDREVLRSGARATREISCSPPGGEPRVYAVSKAPGAMPPEMSPASSRSPATSPTSVPPRRGCARRRPNCCGPPTCRPWAPWRAAWHTS